MATSAAGYLRLSEYITNDGRPVPSIGMSAGLIGNLPLLLATVVFSAPADSLAYALNSIQPRV